jgi:hypothetical protein
MYKTPYSNCVVISSVNENIKFTIKKLLTFFLSDLLMFYRYSM